MIEALPRRLPAGIPLLGALGLAALAARRPGLGGVGVVAALGTAALLVPTDERSRGWGVWAAAVGLGVSAFALVAVAARVPALPFAALPAAASLLAAVAEEAFFRRTLYGWLERWGPVLAIGVTAVLFAAVHLPLYGVGALPLNLAAGVLLGWQRWATGSWTAPAATHAFANLLVHL